MRSTASAVSSSGAGTVLTVTVTGTWPGTTSSARPSTCANRTPVGPAR
jgi:hypothetical protein